ncbi:DUF309 domain-containing protein [Bacillus marinisedimentorum]|uniref:DUF309 domain-containing protein n=1 Tax=Bacillus marinisedimentorum TaxID=1821260 RepID=UPI000871D1A7|nr:DUF309 domain-containing protein [Bacillus marinisedimentorum]
MKLYAEPYLQFLLEFHGTRDYFECHEILEEEWKKEPRPEWQNVWEGLIKIAVSLYHQRRRNFSGAERLMKKAIKLLRGQPDELRQLGIDQKELIRMMDKRLSEIEHDVPYESMNLPLTDERLIERCKNLCERQGFTWCGQSDLADRMLIHRHALRDRQEVISERERQLELKKDNRQSD